VARGPRPVNQPRISRTSGSWTPLLEGLACETETMTDWVRRYCRRSGRATWLDWGDILIWALLLPHYTYVLLCNIDIRRTWDFRTTKQSALLAVWTLLDLSAGFCRLSALAHV